MSTYVITRDGDYYAGFLEGRPVWQYRRGAETQFDGDTADMIVRQLAALGYVGVELKMYRPRMRAHSGRSMKRARADAGT
jgi:hypothetical protein